MILVNKIQAIMVHNDQDMKEEAFSIYECISFVLGAIIDESQGNQQSDVYMNSKNSSRAPKMLVLMWLMFSFLITNSYKSLLRANMIKVDYEQAINTIDDVI